MSLPTIDDQERLGFLTSLADRVDKPDSQDAYVYAIADVADVKLRLRDFDGARKDLEKSQSILDGFDSVETVVHASFYKVNAEYYHVGRYYFPFPPLLCHLDFSYTFSSRTKIRKGRGTRKSLS